MQQGMTEKKETFKLVENEKKRANYVLVDIGGVQSVMHRRLEELANKVNDGLRVVCVLIRMRLRQTAGG